MDYIDDHILQVIANSEDTRIRELSKVLMKSIRAVNVRLRDLVSIGFLSKEPGRNKSYKLTAYGYAYLKRKGLV